jgi:hypothetical protein
MTAHPARTIDRNRMAGGDGVGVGAARVLGAGIGWLDGGVAV